MFSYSWWQRLGRVALAGSALMLAACASVPPNAGQDRRDPLESLNRQTFAFNDALDRAIHAVTTNRALVKQRISASLSTAAEFEVYYTRTTASASRSEGSAF